jgi:TP901 family phage tail tape measure protein
MANEIAQISVNVTSDAERSIPAEVLRGHTAAQRIASSKPIRLSFDTKGSASLNDTNKALERISGSAGGITKSIQAATSRTAAFAVTAGALIAVERAFSSILTTTINVENQLKKIQIIAGGTAQSFSEFSKGIFDVARQTSSSFQETSEAALEFARAGNPLNETLERTASAMTLVKIAGVDVQTAIQVITSTLNTFNSEISDSTVLIDKLSNVDANFAVSANDLSTALSAVGNTATEARVPLDDLLGSVTAVAARTGQSGNVIGNAFRSIFTRIGRADNIELLNSLGVATETVTGQSRNAMDVLRDLSKVYNDLTDSQKRQTAESIAGLYQIGRFQAIIKDLGGSYSIAENASKAATDSFGSANARIKELNPTTASLLEQTRTNLTQLVSAFGELTFQNPLQGFLKNFTADGSFLKTITDTLQRAADPNVTKGVGENIAKGLLAGIGNFISGPGVILLAGALKGAITSALPVLKDIASSFLGVNKALQQQVLLQEQVNNALKAATPTEITRIANAKTLNAQMELTVQLLNQQAAAAAKVSPLIAGLQARGVRPGPNIPNTRRFASGYSPIRKEILKSNFASGKSPVREEISAIKSSSDYVNNRNARPQILENFSVKGVSQTVVINSAEKVVPTKSIDAKYSGPDQFSILNPTQQKTLELNTGYYPKKNKIPNLAKKVVNLTNKSNDYSIEDITNSSIVTNIFNTGYYPKKVKVPNLAKKISIKPSQKSEVSSITDITNISNIFNSGYGIKKDKVLNLSKVENLTRKDEGSSVVNISSIFNSGYIPKKTRIPNLAKQIRKLEEDKSQNEFQDKNIISISPISHISPNTPIFNSGYYPKKVPNLATPIRLSSGLIIDADKRYVFRSVNSGGQFGDITKTERKLSSKTGFETITEKDLAELVKKDPKSIPLLRITDPSRVLSRDFLGNPRYSKIKNKVLVTQSRDLGLDKFQETQKAGGFARSVSLSSFSFKTGEEAVNSFNKLQGELGSDFLIKDKRGLQRQGVYSGKGIKDWVDYIANNGIKAAEQAEGGKEAIKVIKKITQSPSRYFGQKEIKDFGTEYRVPIVGTRGGSAPITIFDRYKANKKGDSFEFSDPEGKMAKISKEIKTKEARDILKVAQSSFSQLPKNRRVGVVAGLDVTKKGVFELNPSDKVGYSGALDNPEIRGKTAAVLGDVSKSEVKRSTDLGLRILNYQGSEEIRKSRFNQFEKALIKLKKDDEVAYFQIAANLVRSGFGLKTGRRKKALFGEDASSYFKVRGFADGYVPNLVQKNPLKLQVTDQTKNERVITPKVKIPVRLDTSTKSLDKTVEASEANQIGLASGYIPKKKIPNLAKPFSKPIKDAIKRESRFVDPSKIYVAEVNTPKYKGPVVANTRDEPNSNALIQAASNAAKGYVPNLASNQSSVIDPVAIQKRELLLEQTIKKFSSELTREVNKVGFVKLLFGAKPEDIVKKIAVESKNLGLSNAAKFDLPVFQEARDEAAQRLSQRREPVRSRTGLGAVLGAPIAAGLVDSFAGQSRGGRLFSSALQGVGVGAIFGGVGAAVGGAAGLGIGALGEAGQGARRAAEERQKQIDARKTSLDAASSLIQFKAQLEDLKNSGSPRDVQDAKREQIREAEKSITDKELLKTLKNLDETIKNPEERFNKQQQVIDTKSAGISRDQRIEDSRFTREGRGELSRNFGKAIESLPLGLSKVVRTIGETQTDIISRIPIFKDIQKGLIKGQTEFNKDEEKVISQGLRASVDFSTIPENIMKDLVKELKGIPGAGFTTQEQQTAFTQKLSNALPENQRQALESSLVGVSKNDFKNIMLDVLKSSQLEQRPQEENRIIRTPSEATLDLGVSANIRKANQFRASQETSLRQFEQANEIEKNSPFVSELTKALAENRLSLEKSINDLEDSRKQSFENLAEKIQKEIAGSNIPLGQIFDELTALNAGGAANLEKNLTALISKLDEVGDTGGNTANALLGLKSELIAQNSVLDSQLNTALRQAGIQDNTLRRLDEIAKNTAKFGGLKGLLTGDRIPPGTARNLSSASFIREAERTLPSPGIVGRVERNRQERDLTIEKGKQQLEAFEKLKLSFGEDFAKKIVNPKDIEKANTADIQKRLIEFASERIESSRLFKENTDIQRNFAEGRKQTLETNDFQKIVDAIQKVRIGLPQNKTDQAELLRVLNIIAEEFKNAPEISRESVAKDFKPDPETPKVDRSIADLSAKIRDIQSKITSQESFRNNLYKGGLQDDTQDLANTSIAIQNRMTKELQTLERQRYEQIKTRPPQAGDITLNQGDVALNLKTTFTDLKNSFNQNISTLTTAIQGLTDPLAQLLNLNSGEEQTSINNIANVSIVANGGGDEKTNQILATFRDAITSLGYKIGSIQKQTKTVIPPTTSNPFSNINNGNISLE